MSNDAPRIAATKEDVTTALLGILPDMRAFARSITKERILADDLVQEATVRALTSAHLYTPGTNFKAWVFTIIRNCFYNDIRLRRRFTALPEKMTEASEHGGQEQPLELCDFRRAFWRLSQIHREVLILIGPSGLSYEEAAAICGVAVGTVKSRVSRARIELKRIFEDGDFKIARRDTSPMADRLGIFSSPDAAWLSEVPRDTHADRNPTRGGRQGRSHSV